MRFERIERGTATAATTVGELTVHRAAGPGGEHWRLALDGRPLAELTGFALGRRALLPVVRRTATGTFAGGELHVEASRHLLAARRYVEFRAAGRAVRVRGRSRLDAHLVEGGRVLARADRGWELAEPDPLRVLAVAVYRWARLDPYLNGPVDDLL
ncbi:hypothetical protein ACFV6F_22090 [Kitasatospora phosalacinea]|uniref:hypothetical protein n=1 Tax=Kitasatospora phosalacinea TaxID=2065 RepID=UPI003646CB31